jgi:hypothetical protein
MLQNTTPNYQDHTFSSSSDSISSSEMSSSSSAGFPFFTGTNSCQDQVKKRWQTFWLKDNEQVHTNVLSASKAQQGWIVLNLLIASIQTPLLQVTIGSTKDQVI